MATGIPSLLNRVASVTNPIALLVADAQLLLGLTSTPKWGIYLNGSPVIIPDSVVAFDYKNEWRIADYPQEAGAFASYNKVSTPFDVRVRLTKGGSEAERASFLNAIEAASKSLNLYDVVTPEKVYSSTNIEHYDYRRTNLNGVGLLTVDIWLLEIRVSGTSQFVAAATPSGASPVAVGTVQATQATPAEQAAAVGVQ
jgi:hypothetical protein